MRIPKLLDEPPKHPPNQRINRSLNAKWIKTSYLRILWCCLHVIGLIAPIKKKRLLENDDNNGNVDSVQNFENNLTFLIKNMGNIIGCGSCRTHYNSFIKSNPPPVDLPKDSSLFYWTIDLHNAVNKRKRVMQWSYTKAMNFYLQFDYNNWLIKEFEIDLFNLIAEIKINNTEAVTVHNKRSIRGNNYYSFLGELRKKIHNKLREEVGEMLITYTRAQSNTNSNTDSISRAS